jgi:hypothetical protein
MYLTKFENLAVKWVTDYFIEVRYLVKLVFISKNIVREIVFSVEFSIQLPPVEMSAGHILVPECFTECFVFRHLISMLFFKTDHISQLYLYSWGETNVLYILTLRALKLLRDEIILELNNEYSLILLGEFYLFIYLTPVLVAQDYIASNGRLSNNPERMWNEVVGA